MYLILCSILYYIDLSPPSFLFSCTMKIFRLEKIAVRQSAKRNNINAICHFFRYPFIWLQDTNVKLVHRL